MVKAKSLPDDCFHYGWNKLYNCFTFSDGEISITGSTGVSIRVDATTWAHAMSFIENIREDRDTWKSASYARPNLVAPEIAGNLNFGPSFPAICKAYWCYHSK